VTPERPELKYTFGVANRKKSLAPYHKSSSLTGNSGACPQVPYLSHGIAEQPKGKKQKESDSKVGIAVGDLQILTVREDELYLSFSS